MPHVWRSMAIGSVAATAAVFASAAFAHGGDPTRIHACVIPPQNAVTIVYAPGFTGSSKLNLISASSRAS